MERHGDIKLEQVQWYNDKIERSKWEDIGTENCLMVLTPIPE
jgi:hypothetical protein